MRLVRLKLHNFRSYEDADLAFSDTQNYVFGGNWQGKSSIMDGIGYALFGKSAFPSKLAGKPVKLDHIVREGCKNGRVSLEFEHQGKKYVIHRYIPKDSPVLYCDGEPIASSITTIKEKFQQLIGINVDIFANVFYSEQDQLRNVLELTPEKRREFIESVIGFAYLKEIQQSAKQTSDGLQQWLDGFTSGDIKIIIEAIEAAKSEYKETEAKISELEQSIAEMGEPKKNVDAGKEKLQQVADTHESILGDMGVLEGRKLVYEGILNEVSGGVCPTCHQQIQEDQVSILQHRLHHVISDLLSQISRAEERLEDVEEDLTQADDRLENSREDYMNLREMDRQKKDLQEELKRQENAVRRLEDQMSAYGNKKMVVELINERCSFLNDLQDAIDDFRTKLRSTVAGNLENSVNSFMSMFSDGDFDAQLRINDDFGFDVLLHGQPVPVFNLSGAARDILALSIRYGLYQIASRDINFILLDEPTHHFDQDNTRKLKEAMNELYDQQLIIITVHDEFYDAVGKKYMVEKDDDYKSIIREL